MSDVKAAGEVRLTDEQLAQIRERDADWDYTLRMLEHPMQPFEALSVCARGEFVSPREWAIVDRRVLLAHVASLTQKLAEAERENSAYRARLVTAENQATQLTSRLREMEGRWESAERHRLHMTGLQIQHVWDFIDSDLETEVLIFYAEERKDVETGELMPAGLYMSLVDYPDEGCVYLPPDALDALSTSQSREGGGT